MASLQTPTSPHHECNQSACIDADALLAPSIMFSCNISCRCSQKNLRNLPQHGFWRTLKAPLRVIGHQAAVGSETRSRWTLPTGASTFCFTTRRKGAKMVGTQYKRKGCAFPEASKETIDAWIDCFIAVLRTTVRTTNLGVILLGAGLSALLIYCLTSELFSSNSPTVIYGDACERIKSSLQVCISF